MNRFKKITALPPESFGTMKVSVLFKEIGKVITVNDLFHDVRSKSRNPITRRSKLCERQLLSWLLLLTSCQASQRAEIRHNNAAPALDANHPL